MTTSSVLATRLIGLNVFKETTFNTPAIPTAKMMGVQPLPSFSPKLKSTVFDEQRGTVVPGYLSANLMKGGAFNFNTHVTYEDILFLLAGGIKGSVAPTGGPVYTWPFPAPITPYTPWNPQTYTFEYGYDVGTIRAAGSVFDKITFKGEASKQLEANVSGWYAGHDQNDAVAIASSTNATPIEITTATAHGYATGDTVIIGSHLVNTAANGTWTIIKTGASTFTLNTSVGNGVGGATGTATRAITQSIVDRTVEIAIVPPTTFWMDTAGVTPKTTQFANVMTSFQLDIETGLKPVYTGDSVSPTDFTYDAYKASLTLNLLFTQAVKAKLAATAFAGIGNVFTLYFASGTKSIQMDFAGVLADDPKEYESKDAAQVIPLKFDARYDTGALANFLKITVLNGVSAIP